MADPQLLAYFVCRPDIQSIKLNSVPRQRNGADCGLFVLSYAEYFCAAEPPCIKWDVMKKLNSKDKAVVNGASAELGSTDFLQKGWFDAANVALLRDRLR
jgi:sentrin-specific protease 7